MKKIACLLCAIFSLSAVDLTLKVEETKNPSTCSFGENEAPADFKLTDKDGNSVEIQLSTLKSTEKKLRKTLKSHHKNQKQ